LPPNQKDTQKGGGHSDRKETPKHSQRAHLAESGSQPKQRQEDTQSIVRRATKAESGPKAKSGGTQSIVRRAPKAESGKHL
jgi:hypothetical protein